MRRGFDLALLAIRDVRIPSCQVVFSAIVDDDVETLFTLFLRGAYNASDLIAFS
jgi:hypothetical protein